MSDQKNPFRFHHPSTPALLVEVDMANQEQPIRLFACGYFASSVYMADHAKMAALADPAEVERYVTLGHPVTVLNPVEFNEKLTSLIEPETDATAGASTEAPGGPQDALPMGAEAKPATGASDVTTGDHAVAGVVSDPTPLPPDAPPLAPGAPNPATTPAAPIPGPARPGPARPAPGRPSK